MPEPRGRRRVHSPGFGEPLVERVDRGAMLRRGRKMEAIGGTKPERVLIDKLRRRPEMPAGDRQHGEASATSLLNIASAAARCSSQVDKSGPQLDRHRRGHLGDRSTR